MAVPSAHHREHRNGGEAVESDAAALDCIPCCSLQGAAGAFVTLHPHCASSGEHVTFNHGVEGSSPSALTLRITAITRLNDFYPPAGYLARAPNNRFWGHLAGRVAGPWMRLL
jgi:hypothetical protein